MPTKRVPLCLLALIALLAALGCGPHRPSAAQRDAAFRARGDWNLKTLVGEYDRTGKRGPAWDDDAREALAIFARIRTGRHPEEVSDLAETLAARVSLAMDHGCEDPLILYLAARHLHPDENGEAIAPRGHPRPFAEAADGLIALGYADVRKFYACQRASEADFRKAGKWDQKGEMARFRREAYGFLQNMIADPATPAAEAAEAVELFMKSPVSTQSARDAMLTRVDTLFPQNWPDDPDAMLRLGRFHISAAWHARGGGNADTVTEEGWKRFEQHLKQAETHLRRGWKADGSDARLPTEMLTVAIGRGFERGEMETWFERAMKADTNNVDACERKLSYLEPKWHGSAEQVLAFGRKCAASGQWGGSVPLILPEAHRRVASYLGGAELRDYWANPAVWTEIRSCYEAFALRSPKQTAFLQQYAWFAYRCGQWQELRRLVDRMGPVNYAYFGGRKAYDRMIQDLEEHSGAEAR